MHLTDPGLEVCEEVRPQACRKPLLEKQPNWRWAGAMQMFRLPRSAKQKLRRNYKGPKIKTHIPV